MKTCLIVLFNILISFALLGQTVKKVSGVKNPAKIGSVNTGSIDKMAAITVEKIYKNCKEILLNEPGSADGIYTIDPDGDGAIEPFDCYCDMTTDGGGWTMVGYFKNPANYEDFIFARSDASYGTDIANPNSTTAWTDWRVLAGLDWPVQFVILLDQPTFTTGWQDYSAKVIHRVKNRDIMPNYGTSQDLTSGDNLYYKFSFASGYTDVGSSSGSASNYWYPRNSGNLYLITFLEGNDYTAYFGSGVPGGDNTWHHSVHMLIR